jgi:dethiobiotin synthetase
MKKFFVTASGTDSGKTVASAILAEALGADYWKPVQAGFPTDSTEVGRLVSNQRTAIIPEKYVLKTPASPHAAAAIDGVEIKLSDFTLPENDRPIIVEGAGGVMVPLNDQDYVIDLAVQFSLPVILVSNLYLGNINHTLLTLYYLHSRRIPLAGLVFNGTPNAESERIILEKALAPCLLRILPEQEIKPETISKYAGKIQIVTDE